MSDVGLGAVLDLNIADALRRIDQLGASLNTAMSARVVVDTAGVAPEITAAVDAADTAIDVTGDAVEVTGAIDAAVDNADTGVVITGEAAEITGDIDAAVENANTHVTITGEASSVTGAVDEALAERSPFGPVSVDGEVSEGLNTGIANLSANLADASDEGRIFGAVLAGLTVGAAVTGLRALGDAASDLQESTTKAQVVFGDQFGQIEQFAQEAAQATGLSTQAALEAAGTFGNLFQALGTSRQEAAKLAPEIVQLGADLASFNNIGVDEALEKIRSGLVGEIEPLRSLGVSFLAADVAAKALELGLGDLNGNLTEGEKVQARYALIVEQTAFAQGDFARTSEGLANQQRILSAEIGDAAAAAGTLLLPAFQGILREARNTLPALEGLGEDVLPALGDALQNLAPLIGTSVDLLVLMAPAVTVLAEALAAIPDEVISIGAVLLTANKGFGLLAGTLKGLGPAVASVPGILRGVTSAVPAATSGVGALGGGVQKLATSVSTLNPFVIAAAAGGAALFKSFSDARDRAADVELVINDLETAFQGVGTVFGTTGDALDTFITELVDSGEKIQSTSALVDNLATGSDVFNALGISASKAADLIAGGGPAITRFADSLGDLSNNEKIALGLLVELSDQAGEAAKSTLAGMAATDELTEGHKRELETLGLLDAPTENYVDLLDRATVASTEAAKRTEELTAFYTPLIAGVTGVGAALADLADTAPEVSSAIVDLGDSGTVSDRTFLQLAGTLDAAALSEEEMALAAQGLGTDVESLQTFIENTTAALDTFVDSAVSGLPTIADAFKDANDDANVSAREFINGLALDATQLNNFIADLDTIIGEGFTDVAAKLAEQGVETAGSVAAELAGAAREGSNALLDETQAGLTAQGEAVSGATALFRDVLGPAYVIESGVVGLHAAAAFGADFDPAEQTRIQMELAALGLSEKGTDVAAVAALVGKFAAIEYGKSLGLDEETATEAAKAGVAIIENNPIAVAKLAGNALGGAFGQGVAEGIKFSQADINTEAERMVNRAEISARGAAGADSPSKLFAELGSDLALGVALGFGDSSAQVVAAAEAIVRDAADAVARVSPAVTASITGEGGATGAGGAGGGLVPDALVRALEAIAATGGPEATQIGPFFGGDVRGSLREATVELQAIRRRRR